MTAPAPSGFAVAVDIGGTFTDVVCRAPDGTLDLLKLPTTRADQSVAVADALAILAREKGVAPDAVGRFIHGTTVATNAVLERKGARIGVITTSGFKDVLEIGRQMRHQMYDVALDPETPVFLAPGVMRHEVAERLDAAGKVLTPLDEPALLAAADALVAAGAEAIAIVFLFSFVNPVHERRAAELIQARHPNLFVSLSHEVDPAFREYERTAVTAFDAYVKPVIDRYLARLETRLAESGVAAPLQIMQSRGGLAISRVARRRPVRLFLSGPAAGVIGGRIVAASAGARDAITVDIGGTSCDIALVLDGEPALRGEGVIGGHTVRVAMVDVNTIGAGGGSIAWIDGAGGLRVGPHSAGSDPGPACYGRGGTETTVTDASVVLGYLNPANFAGGTLKLDAEKARRAITEKIATPLGMTPEAAALGIHRVLNAAMAEGIRLVSIRQGHDPRGCALVPLGGAGAVHATALARELGITRIVVPRLPGVLSAAGLLAAPIEHEASASYPKPLADLAIADAQGALDGLDRQCAALMAEEGLNGTAIERRYFADVCYIGQSYHLEIPFEPAAADAVDRLYRAFLVAHERVYGYAPEAPVRTVNLRAVQRAGGAAAFGRLAEPRASDQRTMRRILVADHPQPVEATVVARAALVAGDRIDGPAIVEQRDTTILIEPGWHGVIDEAGNLVLTTA